MRSSVQAVLKPVRAENIKGTIGVAYPRQRLKAWQNRAARAAWVAGSFSGIPKAHIKDAVGVTHTSPRAKPWEMHPQHYHEALKARVIPAISRGAIP